MKNICLALLLAASLLNAQPSNVASASAPAEPTPAKDAVQKLMLMFSATDSSGRDISAASSRR